MSSSRAPDVSTPSATEVLYKVHNVNFSSETYVSVWPHSYDFYMTVMIAEFYKFTALRIINDVSEALSIRHKPV